MRGAQESVTIDESGGAGGNGGNRNRMNAVRGGRKRRFRRDSSANWFFCGTDRPTDRPARCCIHHLQRAPADTERENAARPTDYATTAAAAYCVSVDVFACRSVAAGGGPRDSYCCSHRCHSCLHDHPRGPLQRYSRKANHSKR